MRTGKLLYTTEIGWTESWQSRTYFAWILNWKSGRTLQQFVSWRYNLGWISSQSQPSHSASFQWTPNRYYQPLKYMIITSISSVTTPDMLQMIYVSTIRYYRYTACDNVRNLATSQKSLRDSFQALKNPYEWEKGKPASNLRPKVMSLQFKFVLTVFRLARHYSSLRSIIFVSQQSE